MKAAQPNEGGTQSPVPTKQMHSIRYRDRCYISLKGALGMGDLAGKLAKMTEVDQEAEGSGKGIPGHGQRE